MFIESAAIHLQAEIDAGAEVSFELGSQTARRRRGATPLYSYHALTGPFIAEREAELARLPGYSESAKLLEGFDGLDRYLAAVGGDPSSRRSRPAGGRARALAAITALLADVFDEQTDFELHPERLAARARAPCALGGRGLGRGEARGDAPRPDDHLRGAARDGGPDDRSPRRAGGDTRRCGPVGLPTTGSRTIWS